MPDAEEVDELRDWVVGHDALQEIALVRPSHSKLVSGQLHPDAIYGILWNDEYLSYSQGIAHIDFHLLAGRIDGQVVERLVALKRQAVNG